MIVASFVLPFILNFNIFTKIFGVVAPLLIALIMIILFRWDFKYWPWQPAPAKRYKK
jgi:uncharacterized membrane protein YkvI